MRPFFRICMIIASVVIVFGFIMTIIAIAGGANLTRLSWEVPWSRSWDDRHTSELTPDNERGANKFEFDEEEEYEDDYSYLEDIENDNGEDLMEDNLDFSKTYKGAKSLVLDIDYGKVNIRYGDEFSIDAVDMSENNFQSYVKDNVWYIKNSYSKKRNILGINVFGIGDDNYKRATINITIPKNFKADMLRLDIGAGAVDADGLYAKELRLDVGAGSFRADNVTVLEEGVFKVGAGQIDLDTMELNDATIDCGVGRIVMDGRITGDSKVNCGIGQVILNLNDDKSSYNYRVDCTVGSVNIDNESYSFTSSTKRINNDAENSFKLNCDIGSIVLKFR